MKILLKNATIIDPKSAFHFQQVDIYICNGIIEEIGEDLSVEADKVIKKDNLYVSTGWFDSSV
jgi:dihydroorotase